MRRIDREIRSLAAVLDIFLVLIFSSEAFADPVKWEANGHWYEVVNAGQEISWQQAKDLAKKKIWMETSGHLATITSTEEQNFLWNTVRKTLGGAWLGGFQDPANEPIRLKNWNWVTGEPWVYSNWAHGEPNDLDRPESYLEIHGVLVPGWNDLGDVLRSRFVVEYDYITLAQKDSIIWCDYTWNLRTTNQLEDPGPNHYSSRNVYVDNAKKLHLMITSQDGHWTCAEIFTKESFGYGTYTFTVESELSDLDPNVVLGLFTYDEHNCDQMYSEVDIEFTRWGRASSDTNLHFTVQPRYMNPDQGGSIQRDNYRERTFGTYFWGAPSKHEFRWTPCSIKFTSHMHKDHPSLPSLLEWTFPQIPTSRWGLCKDGNSISSEILIPKPGDDTRVHINLWLLEETSLPADRVIEVVLSDFTYTPA
jgi:hypothetical protein